MTSVRSRRLVRRFWLAAALTAVVGTLLVDTVSSSATTSLGPGCDTARLAGTWHPGDRASRHAHVATCLTYTHAGYGESWMIVTPSFRTRQGQVVPSTVMRGGSYPDTPVTTPSFGVARSTDRGAHWANLQFGGNAYEPFNRCGSDPGFYRDPITNRTFWYGDGSCFEVSYVVGPMNIDYTDDGGETWGTIADAMNFFPFIFDAAHMLGAPPRLQSDYQRIKNNHYVGAKGHIGNVIYFCGGSTCFPSFDGGVTYDKSRMSSVKALAAGQKDGILYTLNGNQLQVSTDDGLTWHDQGKPIPSSVSVGGIGTGCARAGGAGPLWVDNANNIYVGGHDPAGKLAVTYSRDHGKTWSKAIVAQMPEVTQSFMCAFTADPARPGHIAFAYHGATASTPSPVEHGYLSTTYDLFAARPTFVGGQVDSNSQPLLPNGPPNGTPAPLGPGGAGIPPHSVSRFDFMGVYISPVDGSPWGSFARDRCNLTFCADQPDPNVTSSSNLQRNYAWTGWLGAVGTLVSTRR